MDKKEILQKFRLSTLATVCIAALAACGGHSSHNDEPDDPPVVGDVVLEDGTAININLEAPDVRFTKTVFDARPLIVKMKDGIDEDQKSRYDEMYLGLNMIRSSGEGKTQTNDPQGDGDGDETEATPLPPMHSVFSARLKYTLEITKNEEPVDPASYKIVVRNIKTDIDERNLVVSSGQADNKGDVIFAGVSRKGLFENEKITLEAELCIANAEGVIQKDQEGKDACIAQPKQFAYETNPYGLYKIALADEASCALNRIGSVYCWGSGLVSNIIAGEDYPAVDKVSLQLNYGPEQLPEVLNIPVAKPLAVSFPYEVNDIIVHTSGPDSMARILVNLYSPLKRLNPVMENMPDSDDVKADHLVFGFTGFSLAQQDDRLFLVPRLTSPEYIYILDKDGEMVRFSELYNYPDNQINAPENNPADRILGNVDSLSLAAPHSLMAAAEGRVVLNEELDEIVKSDVEGINNAIRVSGSDTYHCAMTKANEVKCFGALGRGDDSIESTAEQPIQTVVVTKEGARVVGSGEQVTDKIPLRKISVADNSLCLSSVDPVTFKGNLFCWGSNRVHLGGDDDNNLSEAGLLGIGSETENFYKAPQAVKEFADTEIRDFSVSHDHACAVSDGTLFCWGSSVSLPVFAMDEPDEPEDPPVDQPYDKLGLGSADQKFVSSPAEVSLPEKAEKVVAGKFVTCAIDEKGDAYCFGQNKGGQLGACSSINEEPADGCMDSSVKPVKVAYDPVEFKYCGDEGLSADSPLYGETCTFFEPEE